MAETSRRHTFIRNIPVFLGPWRFVGKLGKRPQRSPALATAVVFRSHSDAPPFPPHLRQSLLISDGLFGISRSSGTEKPFLSRLSKRTRDEARLLPSGRRALRMRALIRRLCDGCSFDPLSVTFHHLKAEALGDEAEFTAVSRGLPPPPLISTASTEYNPEPSMYCRSTHHS